MELEEYTQYHEIKSHAKPGFAYNTYICTIPLDFARVRPHWHEEMELIYIKKGAGRVSVDLEEYAVTAGCIALVLPGRLHAIEGAPGAPMEYENILFSPSLLDSPADDWFRAACAAPLRAGQLNVPTLLTPDTALGRRAAACLDAADDACRTADAGYPLLVKSELYRLFYYLYTAPEASAPRHAAPAAARLKAVLTWLAAHYAEPVDVAAAARAASYSPAHFMRFFKAGTGQTFVAYLTDYRLAAAARALAETAAPVGEVAAHCGFESLSYFSRSFRRRYGTSPRAYRDARSTAG